MTDFRPIPVTCIEPENLWPAAGLSRAGVATAAFEARSDDWRPHVLFCDVLTVSIPLTPGSGRIPLRGDLVIMSAGGEAFTAEHWGYTASNSARLVGIVEAVSRRIGACEDELPAAIDDPAALAAWGAAWHEARRGAPVLA